MRRRATLLTLCLFLFSAHHLFAGDFEPPVKDEPGKLSRDAEKWVEKTLKKMSPEEKVGQIIMIVSYAEFQNEKSRAYTDIRDNLQKYHIGGLILTVRVSGPFLLRNQPYEAAMVTNRFQKDSKYPLLVAADFERGLSMRLLATPFFPHAMAFGATADPKWTEEFGKVVARESRAIGVHWNFFPVADVNSNPLNPIINTRSYGEDPKLVGDLLAGYIRGARAGGMLSTAKHFPGHGDTDTDSHLELARVGGNMERLQAIELPPFQRAIDEGVDSIMVAHVTVPALDPEPNKVATTSRKVITDLLINQMKFKGLVVTDALDMRALTAVYKGTPQEAAGRAAVDAFKAGNDLMLMPSNLEGSYNGLLQAVKSGEITTEELDFRVRKVLSAKAGMGLHKNRLVDVNKLAADIARPEDLEMAQAVADAAVTLAKNQNNSLDLMAAEKAARPGTNGQRAAYQNTGEEQQGVVALILTDDVRTESGRVFERELKARVPDANVIYVDPRNAALMLEPVTAAVLRAKAVVMAAYVVPTAFKQVRAKDGTMKNTVGLAGDVPELVNRVFMIAPEKTSMIAMGNPYLAQDFPKVQTYICTFSNAPTAETAAVKALFGEIEFKGKMPVTLPGIAERGSSAARKAAVASGP